MLWSVNSTVNRAVNKSLTLSKVNQPSTYRAPLWSWAAVNGYIRQRFPHTSHSTLSYLRLCIKLFSVTTALVDKNQPFGQVLGGRLQILTCGLLSAKSRSQDDSGHYISVRTSNPKGVVVSLLCYWDNPYISCESVFYMQVWTEKVSAPRAHAPYLGGILLASTTQGNEYKRVGIAATNQNSLLEMSGNMSSTISTRMDTTKYSFDII